MIQTFMLHPNVHRILAHLMLRLSNLRCRQDPLHMGPTGGHLFAPVRGLKDKQTTYYLEERDA